MTVLQKSQERELAALIAERSAPITQFMSSKAASSSNSDKPGLLMSCGLHSSPSVRDASAETSSSSASVKETLVSSYMAKDETLEAEIRWTLHTVEKQSKTGQLVAQSKCHRSSSK